LPKRATLGEVVTSRLRASEPATLETVIGLELDYPSGATIMLMSEAIVVIVFDRGAERDLGISDRRRRAPAAFALVFASFAFLVLFMPHVPQTFAGALVPVFASLAQFMHIFSPLAVLLRARERSGDRESESGDEQ